MKILITLFTCAIIVGQSKDELKRKYGEPISETFRVRPGITATARYASNGQIAELLIAPETPYLIKSRNKTISQDTLKKILDELVPGSERGKYVIGEFVNMDCLPQNDCQCTQELYEKIIIYYNAGRDGANYAVVQWREWMDATGAVKGR
jgi:hypothetical protein